MAITLIISIFSVLNHRRRRRDRFPLFLSKNEVLSPPFSASLHPLYFAILPRLPIVLFRSPLKGFVLYIQSKSIVLLLFSKIQILFLKTALSVFIARGALKRGGINVPLPVFLRFRRTAFTVLDFPSLVFVLSPSPCVH